MGDFSDFHVYDLVRIKQEFKKLAATYLGYASPKYMMKHNYIIVDMLGEGDNAGAVLMICDYGVGNRCRYVPQNSHRIPVEYLEVVEPFPWREGMDVDYVRWYDGSTFTGYIKNFNFYAGTGVRAVVIDSLSQTRISLNLDRLTAVDNSQIDNDNSELNDFLLEFAEIC